MKKVIILSGAPGSGKSYFASQFEQAGDLIGSCKVVSADHFMMENGEYKFAISKLSFAHEACFAKFAEALMIGIETVIVDNTNTEAWEIAPYVTFAKFMRYDVEIREFHGEYQNSHGVAEITVNAMREKIRNRHLPFHMKQLVVK